MTIKSDHDLARKWLTTIIEVEADPAKNHPAEHAQIEANMAAEIAAAREAWGVSREAVAGLVEAVERMVTCPPVENLAAIIELRAAMERAKEGSRSVNCRRCPVVRVHHHRTEMWRYFDWISEWHIVASIVFGMLLLFLVLASVEGSLIAGVVASLLLGIVGAVSLIAIFSDSRTPPSQSP